MGLKVDITLSSFQTSCVSQQGPCYCPDVGLCENYHYLITFNKIVHAENSQGPHNRTYYITINATNNARLKSTQHLDIFIYGKLAALVVWFLVSFYYWLLDFGCLLGNWVLSLSLQVW